MEWQSIETAPKDGTEIVLGNEAYPYYPIGRWTTVKDEPELIKPIDEGVDA